MKTWTRDEIDNLLRTNDRAVERAMTVLFMLQTQDEQQAESTQHRNNRGFDGASASNGSYFAKWLRSGRRLTGKHLDKARRIALRHSRQLVDAANAREQAKAGQLVAV